MRSSLLSNMRFQNLQRSAYPGGNVRSPIMGQQPTAPMIPRATAPNFEQPPVTTPDGPPESDASRYYRLIQGIESEPTPGISAYKEALNQRPLEEDYKPNWMTRIASGLSGFSAGLKDAGKGVEVAYNLNRSPYREALAQYEGNLGNLATQAELEQRDRTTRTKSIMDAANLGLEFDKFTEQKEANRYTRGTQRTQAEAALVRANNSARTTYDYLPVVGGFQVVSKHDPKDSTFVPAKTMDEARLRVSERLAGAAETQARTSADRLAQDKEEFGINTALAGTRIGLQAQNIASQVAARAATANRLPPSEGNSAMQLALREMAMEQRYARYLDEEKTADDFSAAEWKIFQDALEDRVDDILTRKRGGQ